MRTITLLLIATLRIRQPEEIPQLNECIQARFLDATAFGMRRILPYEFHGVRVFRPENATEGAVVDRLQQQNYEVALYLAGRGILTPPTPLDFPRRDRVQGPAYITRLGNPEELPGPEALLEESRRALISFQKGDGYDIHTSGWTVSMRPLRATSDKCVACHNTPGLKIGDALGVAMYVYRKSSN